jgi:hypothetical protein
VERHLLLEEAVTLAWLQGAHDVTTFSHTDVPPFDLGTT